MEIVNYLELLKLIVGNFSLKSLRQLVSASITSEQSISGPKEVQKYKRIRHAVKKIFKPEEK